MALPAATAPPDPSAANPPDSGGTLDPMAVFKRMRQDRAAPKAVATQPAASPAPDAPTTDEGPDSHLRAAQAAMAKMLEPEPKAQPTPPAEQWSSMAMAVAALGGLLTHAPATTSMNAMAGVLKAYKEGDVVRAQQEYEKWKTAHDALGKSVDLELKSYEAALKETDPRRKLAALNAQTAAFRNNAIQRHLDAGDLHGAENLIGGMRKAANSANGAAGEFEGIHAENIALGEVVQQQVADKEKELGHALTKAEKAQIYLDAKAQHQAEAAGLKTGKNAAARSKQNEADAIPDEDADFIAGQRLAGNQSAGQGMSRNPTNNRKVVDAMVRLNKQSAHPMSPAELAAVTAEFQGMVSGERTLGTRTANMEVAANEVKNMAPLALAASKQVDRTQYPHLNSILLAAEQGTGDENVVRFGLAANSLIYTYAKFLNPTGIPTDSDKAKATEILSTAWTQGQFGAAVDQIKKEIASGQTAIKDTRQEFRDGITSGSPGTRPAGQTTPPASPPAVGTIEDGHRFKGGDPANPASWEPVNGR